MVRRIIEDVRRADRTDSWRTNTAITVLTPYEGQRQLLTMFLGEGVEVCSVDAYQGRENDLIILSMTRANESGGIGFAKEPRQLTLLSPVLVVDSSSWGGSTRCVRGTLTASSRT